MYGVALAVLVVSIVYYIFRILFFIKKLKKLHSTRLYSTYNNIYQGVGSLVLGSWFISSQVFSMTSSRSRPRQQLRRRYLTRKKKEKRKKDGGGARKKKYYIVYILHPRPHIYRVTIIFLHECVRSLLRVREHSYY